MRSLACIVMVTALAGCALPAGTTEVMAPEALPSPGTGMLHQDDVTVPITSGALQIKVTPLSESVTRATAPDTYRRLSGLAGRFAPEATRHANSAEPELFLVSFFSEAPDVPFVPEELQIISQGSRYRPVAILPVTPTWGQRRVAQRQTEMAVYAFERGVDLQSDLVVVYGLVESHAWTSILPRVRAELARARARSPN